jgi:hypothetical protein
VDSARRPHPVVIDAVYRFADEDMPAIPVRHLARHVIARSRNEVDGPAALSEPREILTVSVDARRSRRRRMLVDAKKPSVRRGRLSSHAFDHGVPEPLPTGGTALGPVRALTQFVRRLVRRRISPPPTRSAPTTAIPARSRPVNGSVPEGVPDVDPLAPRLLDAGGVAVWPLTMELPPTALPTRVRAAATTAMIRSVRFNLFSSWRADGCRRLAVPMGA